jgi:hypothetical protein
MTLTYDSGGIAHTFIPCLRTMATPRQSTTTLDGQAFYVSTRGSACGILLDWSQSHDRNPNQSALRSNASQLQSDAQASSTDWR